MSAEEFRINKYLSVRLEKNKTIIFVGGKRFLQCKSLLFHLPAEDLNYFEGIKSIDDAQLNFEMISEETGFLRGGEIPPEEEYWGHCSNLQAWYEHGYDTRLLHSNLAFPLLKKLSEEGDPQAKEIFMDEIINRYKNGNEFTRRFLHEDGFVMLLPVDVRFHLELDSDEEIVALYDLWQEIIKDKSMENYTLHDFYWDEPYVIKNRQVEELDLSGYSFMKFPEVILKFSHLKKLKFSGGKITELPRRIYRLKKLKNLDLGWNNLKSLPISICSMENLQDLSIQRNQLKCLPRKIGNLKNLKKFDLYENKLKELPDSIGDLMSLEELYLGENNLIELPESIEKLKNLKHLNLRKNKLIKLPESIGKLQSLESIRLGDTSLIELPESLYRLQSVKELSIEGHDYEYITKKNNRILPLK